MLLDFSLLYSEYCILAEIELYLSEKYVFYIVGKLRQTLLYSCLEIIRDFLKVKIFCQLKSLACFPTPNSRLNKLLFPEFSDKIF